MTGEGMHIRTRSKLALTALAAALVLGALVSDAGARRFEVSNQHFRAVFAELKTIGSVFGIEIACAVTLEGSVHSRTISKVSGQLIGYITRAIVTHPCTEGEMFVLNGFEPIEDLAVADQTLPWHVRFNSFAGTLPNISRLNVQVIRYSILISTPLEECLYQSDVTRPAFMEFEIIGGHLERLRHDETRTIPLLMTLGGLCEPTVRLAHDAPVKLQGSATTRIRVALVQ
jgi:hypothetical protein